MITIHDTQLEHELQELHLVSAHWISDIRFIQDEIRFFKDLIYKKLPQINDEQLIRVQKINTTREKLEAKIDRIQNEILEHIKKIEPLIHNSKQPIELSLIEEHANLENDLNDQLQSFTATKRELFSLLH